ncbi:TIR domain-containing protein [Actinomadura sp. ATCC 31491]|uniref:TIR domain-containing protein n=1 Tax=Actinomadura luzonensis TaxID=2805427 RepID=A0ABT0G106_9ACTN|nr:TIR domain-containing protein [Actinomadura luzonensis]MCK2218292.1 TIR domain-containing protein [Actinomadura luzonensis]
MRHPNDEIRNYLKVFICFTGDGAEFAVDLHKRLDGLPFVIPWIYTDRPLGLFFPDGMREGIDEANVLIAVVTRQLRGSQKCTQEIIYAQRHGKSVIPLLVHPDAPDDVFYQGYSPLDCTGGLARQWDQLRRELEDLATSKGTLARLKQERDTVKWELERAGDERRPALADELSLLDARISELEARMARPRDAMRMQEEQTRLSQEREKQRTSRAVESSGIILVNDPPPMARNLFLDREDPIDVLKRCLHEPRIRLLALFGRPGIGKTAMISQWREGLLEEKPAPIGAFVYLTPYSTHPLRPAVLLEDLRKTVRDPAVRDRLGQRLNDRSLALADKLDEVLRVLTEPTVVVIDDAEALLDSYGRISDPALGDIVARLMRRSDHPVKIVLITDKPPNLLINGNPATVAPLNLEEGLPAPVADFFLRALDEDDACGLRNAHQEDLAWACKLTDGSPRALQALSVVLRQNRDTSLPELLRTLDGLESGQAVLNYLIGRVFDRVDREEWRVLQVLAVYRRPVPHGAVDSVLRQYLPGCQSEPTLRHLTNKRLIRRFGDRYYLPPLPDGEFVFSQVRSGSPDDDPGSPEFTKLSLCRLAATFYRDARKRDPRSVDDLDAYFAEIDLLMRAHDHVAAYKLIDKVDEDHLSGWGHSDALDSWRRELIGKLDFWGREVNNLVTLADARGQQGDLQQQLAFLEDAVKVAEPTGHLETLVGLDIDVGSARLRCGLYDQAHESYVRAEQGARELRDADLEAQARHGLALCLARMGRLEEALRLLNDVGAGAARGLLDAERLLSLAWVLGQLDRTDEAKEALRRGHDLRKRDDWLLEGHLFAEEAEILIAEGQWQQALAPAREATKIAARTRDSRLSCEANRTLAVALLCGKQIDEAWHAANTAVHNGDDLWSMSAFAVKGIAAFRHGRDAAAREAFLEAYLRARTLHERAADNYQVLDTKGLVLYGLNLCGGPEQFDRAVAAYRKARHLAPARGAARRARLLLEQLCMDGHPEGWQEICRAASGR